ncbi:MAG: hypothetical protein ILO64_04135 [Clostridia bacterium]|nr:hypothetical protein [Clostridia bacterium]
MDLISPSAKRSISPKAKAFDFTFCRKAKDFTIAFSANNRKLTYIFRGAPREMEGQPRFFLRANVLNYGYSYGIIRSLKKMHKGALAGFPLRFSGCESAQAIIQNRLNGLRDVQEA